MFRITQSLSVGRYASPERAGHLRAAGVTHVLNVSDAPSKVVAGDGSFAAVEWVPLDDAERLTEAEAVRVLDTLHRLVSEPGAHVYVHCVAGQLRSPTVIWLYLIACGFDPSSARDVIETRSPDAAPGARRLVGPGLVYTIQTHGLRTYFPHPRPEALVPHDDE
jgi:hypothetical protein